MSRRAAAGDSTMCPSAATWTSPVRSSGGVGLTRNQAAPARTAPSTYWTASKRRPADLEAARGDAGVGPAYGRGGGQP